MGGSRLLSSLIFSSSGEVISSRFETAASKRLHRPNLDGGKQHCTKPSILPGKKQGVCPPNMVINLCVFRNAQRKNLVIGCTLLTHSITLKSVLEGLPRTDTPYGF